MFVVNEALFRIPNVAAFVVIVNVCSARVAAALGPVRPLVDFLPPWVALIAYTVYTLLLLDLGSYITHVMQHNIRLFWRFHAVHHSAEAMNPLTVFRQHPLDMAHYTLLRGLFAGVGAALFPLVFPGTPGIVRLAGVNAGLVLYYITAGLRHSPVPFAYPACLRWLFFSPHLHQVHHSRDPRHVNCNYGVIFSIWDRCFGTYLDVSADEVRFGLADGGRPYHHSLWRMYLEPLGLAFPRRWQPAGELPEAAEPSQPPAGSAKERRAG